MIALTTSKDGVLVPVRVSPRAKANRIDGVRDGVLLMVVNAPVVDGAANAAVLQLLAKALRCAKSTLSIARGGKSRDKTVCVAALDESEIQSRLAAFLNDLSQHLI